MQRKAVLAVLLALSFALPALAQTDGVWSTSPEQDQLFEATALPPARDGAVLKGKRAVIPVKFALETAFEEFSFVSNTTDTDTTNDASSITFTPETALTFADLIVLSAEYDFIAGNCGGGSLRWSVRVDVGNDGDPSNDANIFIYYGEYPNFTSCDEAASQSGVNLLESTDLRFDLTQLGGPYYGSYADAVALAGSLEVVSASLVLDSGWFAGPQEVEITSVTVNDNTFEPLSGSFQQTCDLPEAEIRVTSNGEVVDVESQQRNDDDDTFRISDCEYIYNLATDSLNGPGTYTVEILIDGEVVGSTTFTIQ